MAPLCPEAGESWSHANHTLLTTLLTAFIVDLIEIAVRDYMSDDEEAERNIDGLVRNELVAFPNHFMRYIDDAYVMQDAATVALGDIFNGVLRRTF